MPPLWQTNTRSPINNHARIENPEALSAKFIRGCQTCSPYSNYQPRNRNPGAALHHLSARARVEHTSIPSPNKKHLIPFSLQKRCSSQPRSAVLTGTISPWLSTNTLSNQSKLKKLQTQVVFEFVVFFIEVPNCIRIYRSRP